MSAPVDATRFEHGPGVLVAEDLTPGEVADLDAAVTTGLVLAGGSATAHAVLVARARGLPVVVGAGAGVLALREGTVLALDGGTGELVVDPDPGVRADFVRRARDSATARDRDRVRAAEPGTRNRGGAGSDRHPRPVRQPTRSGRTGRL